jgi:hypothetical protein
MTTAVYMKQNTPELNTRFMQQAGHMIPAPARTIAELTARLLIAHRILISILTENAGEGGLAEQWKEQVKKIEQLLKHLRKDIQNSQSRGV